MTFAKRAITASALLGLAVVAGCSQSAEGLDEDLRTSAIHNASAVRPVAAPSRSYRASEKDRECLARAMFFESHRSSRDGLVAVGSVVMNRLDSGEWGDDICSVVGAKRQFAPGVLTRPMKSDALPDVMQAADAVLEGERHPDVSRNVMFFHAAGLKFPYKNMHYTTVAGGNAFYEKSSRRRARVERPEPQVATNEPDAARFGGEAPQMIASPVMDNAGEAALPVAAFNASAEQATAIGALLLAQRSE